MATEIVEKKKHDQEQVVEGKSKGLNTLLWILSVADVYKRQHVKIPKHP